MPQSRERFLHIISEVPDAIEGKMFGAYCIKSTNGKAAAILWNDNMQFKLNERDQQEALRLDGASIGSHLYNTDKPMKGWISLPLKHSDKWPDFTKKALIFVNTPVY